MSPVSKDPWRFLLGEIHARRGLAMGRMGITNAIMLPIASPLLVCPSPRRSPHGSLETQLINIRNKPVSKEKSS